MKYRKLGNTGLIVSEVALGTMQFGGKMNMGNLGQEDTTRMVKLALDKARREAVCFRLAKRSVSLSLYRQSGARKRNESCFLGGTSLSAFVP